MRETWLKEKTTLLFAGFVVFYILSVLVHLNYYPLNGEEPRRALVSIEMRHAGNYIMPTTLGWEYYNKPPLYNWMINACMFLTGTESETAVRMPSLIFLLLWAFVNYKLFSKFAPREVAALSSLFLLTGFDIFFWGLSNGGEMDIFYSFIVYMQVMMIFYFNHQKKWLWLFVLSYLFCAIGLLTKGFPSVMFQGLTLIALCVYNRSIKILFRWEHLMGIFLFFLIAGAYFYAYSFYSSPWRYIANLLKQSLDKSAIGEYPERLVRKVVEFPFSFLKLLLPWSLLLLLLIKKRSFSFWQQPIVRFGLLFILFNLPVYWFTGQPRMRYCYMFVPFCMLIIAWIFYESKVHFPSMINKILKWSPLIFTLVLLGVLLTPFIFPVNHLWVLAVAAVMLAYLTYRKKSRSLWYFGFGIVLFRFAIAAVYAPVWYEKAAVNYDREMANIAALNNFHPLTIYGRPDTIDLSIDLKVSKLYYDHLVTLPFLAYQVPYYYYLKSGHLVKYDTVLHKNTNYLGYRSDSQKLAAEVIYSFRDRNRGGDEIVLFKIPD